MLAYLSARARTPETVVARPDAAEIERLERFLDYVDDLIAARNARFALGMGHHAIAFARRHG